MKGFLKGVDSLDKSYRPDLKRVLREEDERILYSRKKSALEKAEGPLRISRLYICDVHTRESVQGPSYDDLFWSCCRKDIQDAGGSIGPIH